jgi:hypothetical protein
MAKAAWCSASPASGTAGSTTVSVGGTAHTGRSNRSTKLTFQTTAGSPQQTKELDVIQLAAGNILTKTAPGSIGKAGGSIIVTGTSNAPSLSFAMNTGSADAFILSNFQISTNGGSTWTGITNATAIANDPGASATYQWRCTITAAANTFVSARSSRLFVSNGVELPTVSPDPTPDPSTGLYISADISQAAGDATLTLSASSLSLAAAGTAKTVTATSNTTYSVS